MCYRNPGRLARKGASCQSGPLLVAATWTLQKVRVGHSYTLLPAFPLRETFIFDACGESLFISSTLYQAPAKNPGWYR